MKFIYVIIAIMGMLLNLTAQAAAAPVALRDDVQIRLVTSLERGTMRIAKDPRDNVLYTLTTSGTISRVEIKEEPAALVARGVLDDNTGEFTWTLFDLNIEIPAETPIDEILSAGEDGNNRAVNPVDGKRYGMSLTVGDILLPPRTVVATPADYGIDFPAGFFIDEAGIFYVVRDVEKANMSSQVPLYTSSDHGYEDTQGLAVGPDGSFYLGATTRVGKDRMTHAVRGRLDPATGDHTWATIASTELIPKGSKDHPHPGVAVSPDGRWVFINSGSRTDHGEESNGLREVPLSAAILRVPSDGESITIPADAEVLRASGYLYADGLRNAFDIAFAGNGDMFAGDNGPDSDLPESVAWVREGHHFGFPWRIGGVDNPTQFSDYDPAADHYIRNNPSRLVREERFYNDPGFPAPPMVFTDPIANQGPDADRFRDPLTGEVNDASDLGLAVYTLTPHSSPLGLVFDVDNALSPEFMGDGFLLRIGGQCCDLIDIFDDPDQDLLHMDLEKVGDNYEGNFTRIVSGFSGPIDAEIVGNKIYVVEWTRDRGLWEITLPPGAGMTAVEDFGGEAQPEHIVLAPNYPNPFNPNTTIEYQIDRLGMVEVAIFDMLGRKVRTLVAAEQGPGRYRLQWDGLTAKGAPAASGVYLYRLQVGDYRETRRLTLLK